MILWYIYLQIKDFIRVSLTSKTDNIMLITESIIDQYTISV